MYFNHQEKTLKTSRSNRGGYALLMVMVFVVLFAAILGVAWRRVSSALRIEYASAVRKQCDQGSIQAMAEAMKTLENRLRRPASGAAALDVSSDPATHTYQPTCLFKSSAPYDISNDPACPDLRWYVITFTYLSTNPSGTERWSIKVTSTKTEPTYPALPP